MRTFLPVILEARRLLSVSSPGAGRMGIANCLSDVE